MVLQDVAMTALTKSMDALSYNVKAALDFADKAQSASLALGKTYEETRVQLGGTIEGLRGDINQRFQAGILSLEAGLQGNTAGVAKLINQQQLTNTSFGKTADTVASLEAQLGLSRNDTNLLSENLIQTGSEFTISTDKLVGAIDALKATFPAQKLAGMGAQVLEAVTLIQGELGPQLAGPLQNVMKLILDSSLQGFERLQVLGIEDVRGRLTAAKSSAEAQQILKDAFVTASDRFKSISGGVNASFLNIAAASETFGSQTIEFTTIADNLGKRVREEGKEAADFGKTLANLKKEALVPFQEAFTLAYPFLLEAVDTFSAIINTVGRRFKAFAESLGGEAGAAASMKKFKLFVLDIAIVGVSKFETVFGFFDRFVREIVPNVFTSVYEVFNNFTKVGGTLDLIKVGFFSILVQFAKFIHYITADLTGGISRDTMLSLKYAQADAQARMMADTLPADVFERRYGKKDPTIREQVEQAMIDSVNNNEKNPTIIELKRFRDEVSKDRSLRRRSTRALEDIDRKTPEIKTQSQFLDETANMLGRSIEGILGIGRDSTAAEMLEELKIANEQRAAQDAKSPAEYINTGS